ncbi:hypothetical protein ACFO4O_08600 [Glaciecola siphonariae]|uniref:Uncharacterized protein n=1 Tax=Glaciecola siphonariae TaxID=521012 RepID=A0ABV9LUM3_9ALTE
MIDIDRRTGGSGTSKAFYIWADKGQRRFMQEAERLRALSK